MNAVSRMMDWLMLVSANKCEFYKSCMHRRNPPKKACLNYGIEGNSICMFIPYKRSTTEPEV